MLGPHITPTAFLGMTGILGIFENRGKKEKRDEGIEEAKSGQFHNNPFFNVHVVELRDLLFGHVY